MAQSEHEAGKLELRDLEATGEVRAGDRKARLPGSGMTQIDPPSLELDAGPADMTIDSCADELGGVVVLC